MAVQLEKIIELMETIAPIDLAESWDNVGLQVESGNNSIKSVLVALEATEKVVNEAKEKKADLIITHHPLIFKPIKSVTTKSSIGRIINDLIKNDISLYCSHTNLDFAENGTNVILAQLIGIEKSKPFIMTEKEKYFKIVVYVPEENLESVRDAMGDGGAGYIGNYSGCTFSSMGIGTFIPNAGSNPYIGTINRLQKVKEYRLETIVSKENLTVVIDKMLKAHPYEEVAYDIIPLENKFNKYGLGRVGNIPNMKLVEFCEQIKQKLKADHLKVVGDLDKKVNKVCVCSGSGAAFIDDAYRTGCDCFITGDVKYHEAQYALELGMALVDAGHFETENIMCSALVEQLNAYVIENKLDVNIFPSSSNINPFQIL